jgi:hypothetical protein
MFLFYNFTTILKNIMPPKRKVVAKTVKTPWVQAAVKYHKAHPDKPLLPKKGSTQYKAIKAMSTKRK